MRWPSKAACPGVFKPLPVRVARIAPVAARTTATEGIAPLAAQRLVPSKAGICTAVPTVTVSRIAPAASTLRIVPGPASETQMFEPSKTTPLGDENPVVTVVAVQG